MTRHRFPFILTLVSLTTLGLGAAGCSNGQSPTEPAFTEDSLASSVSEDTKRRGRGADDPAGDDRGGQRRGGDDNANDDRGGRRGGRGGNDANDDNGGRRGGRQAPRAGVEFEGTVASISGGTLVLANGTRVIVTGHTQWIARGDLSSLGQLSNALSAGQAPRVEGRGNRDANGAIVAQSIKAEIDQR